MGISSRAAGVGAVVIATLVVGAGVADASTGASFILGHKNTATSTTTLADSKGTPLALTAKKGHAPLKVNSSAKVAHLNADELDGLESNQLQRRVGQACQAGSAIRGISPSGSVTCQKAGGGSGSFSSTVAAIASGVGIAYCPAGSNPISGGAVPDATGLTDIPFIAASVPHATNGTFDGWEVIMSDSDGSYDGTGYVYATCTTASVDLAASPALKPAQLSRLARTAQAQFETRH
jgi:hypothetical protein